MLKFLPFLLFLFVSVSHAQKKIQRSYPSDGVEEIVIDGSRVFEIRLKATDTRFIEVNSKINGEGYENVLLQAGENEGVLRFAYNYTPFYEPKNDKLAAHKVMAIEMELVIPNGMRVSIVSNLASVQGEGRYQQLDIELTHGAIELNGFLGNGRFRTKDGNIIITALVNDLGATAVTHQGSVINELSAEKKFNIRAESVKGDITLLKSQ